MMGARKLLRVPINGQISIGKRWAGKEIVIEEINDSEIHISSGTFVLDSNATFFTQEAKNTLDDFDNWSTKNPPKKTDLKKLRAELGNKKKK
jgi:hypothetical protein